MKYITKYALILLCFLVAIQVLRGQSPSFCAYVNPVIPGDHSDCTLTKVGCHFYTTGSSFNPTPIIYHSTDLVHWEAIAQPVSAAWPNYGEAVAGGCWGGQIVHYNNKYWDFFGRAFVMYFVTADKPEGPWSTPTKMNCPASVPGLGADNSIFIDTDSTWYLLVKNGQANNWILQLGKNGQPAGNIYDFTWLNPSPSYPYSWAEGPVMWKNKGYYYYSFAINVAGGQKVMRSTTLTGDQSAWTMLGDFFNVNDPLKSKALFQTPNHNSAAVMIEDSTSWIIHPTWANANGNEWWGQGRQGLLNQVLYDTNGIPMANFPINTPKNAPKLSSSGIPWMVPKSDFFSTTKLNPEWSFLGYTPLSTHSLTERPGWLRIKPKVNTDTSINTIIKNDAEHNYSLITHLDFNASVVTHEAGIRIMNGLQNLFAKIYSSVNSSGKKIICFGFNSTLYTTYNNIGNDLWLKIVRVNHLLSGYFSANGLIWTQVGSTINISSLDGLQSNYNGWCGNRQGLYVRGHQADFDLYIYRDAYTQILAGTPANQFGTIQTSTSSLDSIHSNDWALYAGVEFGSTDYAKTADSVQINASALIGGNVEIWLDSIDTGTKIGTCPINPTGSWLTFKSFSTKITQTTGRHDVYLKFTGSSVSRLFQIKWLQFVPVDLSPQIVSTSTNSTGDSIVIQLNKKMYSPSAYVGQFSIKKNAVTNIALSSITVKSNDSSIFVAKLSSNVYYEDTLTISYSGSTVKSYNGYTLKNFNSEPVSNISAGYPPKLTAAIIRKNDNFWNLITLRFDRLLTDVSSQKDYFTIIMNGQSAYINAISGNSDSIQLSISPAPMYADVIKISYSGGSVSSINGGLLADITDYTIPNEIPSSVNFKNVKQNKVVIYPVPLRNELKVKSDIEFNVLKIYNLEGRIILEKHYEANVNTATVNINLKEGSYIIRLGNEVQSFDSTILAE